MWTRAKRSPVQEAPASIHYIKHHSKPTRGYGELFYCLYFGLADLPFSSHLHALLESCAQVLASNRLSKNVYRRDSRSIIRCNHTYGHLI